MKNGITPTAVLRRVWRTSHELKDENRLALFDESRSELVILNAVGGAVWELLDGHRTVEQLTRELVARAEHAPDPELAREEVTLFLTDLLRRAAVEVLPG